MTTRLNTPPEPKIRQLIQDFESILQNVTGERFKIHLQPYSRKHDPAVSIDYGEFLLETRRIRSYCRSRVMELHKSKVLWNAYYAALYIVMKKYPMASDRMLAEAFEKKNRTTINKARVMLSQHLQFDPYFHGVVKTLNDECVAGKHLIG